MVSDTEIINDALDWIGQQNINSIDQTTGNGPKAKRAFLRVRDSEQQKARWTFNKIQSRLTAITNEWGRCLYAYQRPADCLKIHYVGTGTTTDGSHFLSYSELSGYLSNRQPVWENITITDASGNPTGRTAILCDLPDAFMVYSKLVTDCNIWPPTFRDLVTLEVAYRLTSVLFSDPTTIRKLQGKINEARMEAQLFDANEDKEGNDDSCSILDSRF
jgi:hypothetical protein